MSKAPTLTDPAGLGGMISQDGFDYQLRYGLSRVPAWLADPTFEAMIFEGLEDIEARFFHPQTPRRHTLERVQAKSSDLTPGGVKTVLDHFLAFEAAAPLAARRYVLATPRLPAALAFVERDLRRLRLATPFYQPFPDVLAPSDARVLADLEGAFGLPAAELLLTRGQVDLFAVASPGQAEAQFASALHAAFPGLSAPYPAIQAAFAALVKLGNDQRHQAITREALMAAIVAHTGPLFATAAFPLHMQSDRPDAPSRGAFVFDARAVATSEGMFQPADAWAATIGEPLAALADWLGGREVRRIALSGVMRLSTGLVLGAAFPAAKGFNFDISVSEDVWRTDDHPRPGSAGASWRLRAAERLRDGRLTVTVGSLRDPQDTLIAAGVTQDEICAAYLTEAVRDAQHLQTLVIGLKRFVAAEVARLKPQGLDLYLLGPLPLAVAIGHRWNAMAATQVYAFDGQAGAYRPTATI